MHWTTWCLIALIVYAALLPIALAFLRGAAILNNRIRGRDHDEHEQGLTL